MYGRPQVQVSAPSHATLVSDSVSVMIGASLLVLKSGYLRFGDSALGLLEDENVLVDFIDTKSSRIAEWS
jgi:hypothetical protein